MESKAILVTGGEGFIGNALIAKLLERDSDSVIYSIDTNIWSINRNFKELGNGRVIYISPRTYHEIGQEMNLRSIFRLLDFRNLFKLPEGFDEIYHFGEFSRVLPSLKGHSNRMRCLQMDSENLLFLIENFLIGTECKFVYSGSSTKFDGEGCETLSEALRCPYALGKANNVNVLKGYRQWFELDITIVYFYNVYGPGQICEGQGGTVVGIFEKNYLEDEVLYVNGGNQVRNFTHIDDTVDGILEASENYKYDQFEYHLGDDDRMTIYELACLFEGAKIKLVPMDEKIERPKSPTPGRYQQPPNWKPKHRLEEYVADVVHRKSIANNHK